MKTINIEAKLNTAYHLLKNKGYDVVYIGLYGSQNYNLNDKESDVDLRAIVLLDLPSLIQGKTISKTIDYEFGQIDIKDIWSYYKVIKKGNPSFLEPILSDWWLGSKEIREILSEAKPNAKAMWGMMMQKISRYKKHKDPKDAHHIIRLVNLFYTEDETPSIPKKCFKSYHDNSAVRRFLLCVKREVYDHEDINKMVEIFEKDRVVKLRDFLKDYKYKPIEKDKEVVNLIVKTMKEC